jgi:hypothetical protein
MQSKMVVDAEKMIDRMIPEEGLSTFGDPTGRSLFGLFGLGAMDLDASGSAAFSGDLDNEGTAAFGNSDLDSIGTSAFAGDLDTDGTNAFGGFGAVGIRKFASKLRGIVTGKKEKAKANLQKVAVAQKQANSVVASESRKAMLATNPAQKALFMKRAQAAQQRSSELARVAKVVAVEAVNPKITRDEVKAAVLPAIEDMATSMSVTGKAVIDTAAKQDVSKEAMKEVLAQSAASAVAPSVVPPPEQVPLAVKTRGVGPATRAVRSRALARKALSGLAGSGGISGFLSMGDMDTATQDAETVDIVQDWRSDEMFGEPLF